MGDDYTISFAYMISFHIFIEIAILKSPQDVMNYIFE